MQKQQQEAISISQGCEFVLAFLFCSVIDETFQVISLSLTFQYAVCFAGLS